MNVEETFSEIRNLTSNDGVFGELVLTMISMLILNMQSLNKTDDYPQEISESLQENNLTVQFDYIIVGGGTAGCVMANKLSQLASLNVLLLEAGGVGSVTSAVPYYYQTLNADTWYYPTNKVTEVCQAMDSQTCMLRGGKGLGGTTNISPMHYQKANKDDWEDYRWRYCDIPPYYETLEEHLCLGKNNENHHIKKLLQDANEELVANSNFEEKSLLIKKGLRRSYAKAFLTPAKDRPNLFIALKSEVEEILFGQEEGETSFAQGVVANVNGVKTEIFARKEIVLCAGAINNAKLLMLSGYGPHEMFEQLNKTMVIDLPVGKNLQTRYMVPVFIAINETKYKEGHDALQEEVRGLYSLLMRREGFLTTTGLNSMTNFIVLENSTLSIGINYFHFPPNDNENILSTFQKTLKYSPKIVQNLIDSNKNRSLLVFGLILLQPKSTGEVLLRSTRPADQVIINNKFLSDEEEYDLNSLVEGFRSILNLSKSVAFEEYKAELLNFDLAPCNNQQVCSDGYIKCYVKNMGHAVPHSIGTTKLGPRTDPTSVVDEHLVVYGTNNLRVVDGSVMSSMPTGDVASFIGVIAERIADRMW